VFFIASKVFYFLITPVSWIIVLLLAAIFTKQKGRQKFYLVSGVSLLLIFSNPFLINQVMSKWEYPATPRDQLPLTKTAVVLGGMLNQDSEPEEQVHFSESVERILEALLLEKSGLTRELIISGGSGSVLDQSKKESIRLKQFVDELYKKPPKIILDTISRNTYENAVEVYKILELREMTDQPILLITSAFHMKRSILCFQKQGLTVIPYAVDFKSKPLDFDLGWLVPSVNALMLWEIVIKEWVGIGAYKVFGYV